MTPTESLTLTARRKQAEAIGTMHANVFMLGVNLRHCPDRELREKVTEICRAMESALEKHEAAGREYRNGLLAILKP